MWVNTVSGQNEHVGKKTVRRGLSEGEGGGEGWASWCVCVCVCVMVGCVWECVCVCVMMVILQPRMELARNC